MKRLILVLSILLTVPVMSSCNATATANKAEQIISAVLQTAKVEASAIPPADQAAYNNFVALGLNLDGQLKTCINNVGGIMGKGAKFASCFNTFASSLLSPQELAQLRIISTSAQQKVQLYVTAVVAGVNVIVQFKTPQISAAAVTTAERQELLLKVYAQDPQAFDGIPGQYFAEYLEPR